MNIHHDLNVIKSVAIQQAKDHNCNYNIIISNHDNGTFNITKGSTYEIVADSYFEKDRPNARRIHTTDALIKKEKEKEAAAEIVKYEDEIGITALKENKKRLYYETEGKSGKYWLALSPKLVDDEMKSRYKTDYKIMYWVNYGDDNTYGWFTVEHIKMWLSDQDLKLHTLGGTKER